MDRFSKLVQNPATSKIQGPVLANPHPSHDSTVGPILGTVVGVDEVGTDVGMDVDG